MLRTEPRHHSLEEFRKYTESWKRPAGIEKEAVFRVWSSDEGPPSHSIPPHLVAKAATRLGPEAFEKIHKRLLKAYFTENRNITDIKILRELWEALELPLEVLEKSNDPEILKQIVSEHNEAVNHGVNGVPAIVMEGFPGALIGAQEDMTYRRIFQKALESRHHLPVR